MKFKSTFHTLFQIGAKGWEAIADFESAADAHEHAAELAEGEDDFRYLVQETHQIETREAAVSKGRDLRSTAGKKSSTKKTSEE
jgi:hypothetical protein